MSNVEQAYEFFLGQGFTSAQSAGIVGNLIQESGVNPESVQPDGPGRGIAQWSVGGRWRPSLATGNVQQDLSNQEQYVIDELQSNPAYGLAALRQATTPVQAAQIFGSDYERYGKAGARLSDAQQVFDEAQTNNWPSVSSNAPQTATLTGVSVSGASDALSQVAQFVFPGLGLFGSASGAVSDVGKIAGEIAGVIGLGAQKQPQQLDGSTFLGSVDGLLNPSVTLFNPWKGITMVMARSGLALLGVGMIVAGFAIMALGTQTGREAIGVATKAALA